MMLHLLTATALAGTLPPGDPLERAAAVHLTAQGLDNLGTAVGELLPPTITEEVITGEFECASSDAQPLAYTINNLELNVEVLESRLTPSQDTLTFDLQLRVAGASDDLIATGQCFSSQINQVCAVEIPEDEAIIVTAQVVIEMTQRSDGEILVNVYDPDLQLSTLQNPVAETTDCALDDLIDAFLLLDEDFLTNLIWSFLGPELQGLGNDLEGLIADALDALWIDTSLSLGGTDINLSLWPSEFEINDDGLLLGLGAAMEPDAIAECAGDSAGTEVTEPPWPAFGATSWDGTLQHDAVIALSRDFADVLLWNVWATGTFCLEVSDLAGAQLGTDLLGQIMGESFAALFPEDQPAALKVVAAEPPTSRFDTEMPLYIDLHQLNLNAIAGLDHRDARICEVSADGWIGVEVGLEGSSFAPSILVEPEALTFTESWTELIEPGYSEGIAGFLPTVLGSLLPDDLLPSIDIPTYQGIGVDSLTWQVDESDQWLGGYVMVDTAQVEPLQISGCSSALGCGGGGGGGFEDILGCGDSGCGEDGCSDTSCSTHQRPRLPGGRLAIFGFMLAMAVLRRRS